MEPEVDDQAAVRVKRTRFLLPGDVVAFRVPQHNRLVVHRFLGYVRRRGEWRLMIKADRETGPDPLVATACVLGKVANARTVLLRAMRDHPDKVDAPALQDAIDRLAAAVRRLQGQLALDEVRGIEGDAARVYFNAFDHLIIREKDHFFMQIGRAHV